MTAVEWLEKQLTMEQWNDLQDIVYKALEMEKQQSRHIIEMARDASICECALGIHIEYEHSEDSIIEQLKQK
jgi:hypothetical protein